MKAPFRDIIEDDRLQAVADAWWQCRLAGTVPYWRHMPRLVLKPLLPAVLLCHYVPGEQTFQLETLTEDLRGLTRLPINGKRIEHLLPGDAVPDVRAQLLAVIGGPTVDVIKVGDRAKPERGTVEERLLLPLRSGGRGAPDLILVVHRRLDPSAAGWLPITQEARAIHRLPISAILDAA